MHKTEKSIFLSPINPRVGLLVFMLSVSCGSSQQSEKNLRKGNSRTIEAVDSPGDSDAQSKKSTVTDLKQGTIDDVSTPQTDSLLLLGEDLKSTMEALTQAQITLDSAAIPASVSDEEASKRRKLKTIFVNAGISLLNTSIRVTNANTRLASVKNLTSSNLQNFSDCSAISDKVNTVLKNLAQTKEEELQRNIEDVNIGEFNQDIQTYELKYQEITSELDAKQKSIDQLTLVLLTPNIAKLKDFKNLFGDLTITDSLIDSYLESVDLLYSNNQQLIKIFSDQNNIFESLSQIISDFEHRGAELSILKTTLEDTYNTATTVPVKFDNNATIKKALQEVDAFVSVSKAIEINKDFASTALDEVREKAITTILSEKTNLRSGLDLIDALASQELDKPKLRNIISNTVTNLTRIANDIVDNVAKEKLSLDQLSQFTNLGSKASACLESLNQSITDTENQASKSEASLPQMKVIIEKLTNIQLEFDNLSKKYLSTYESTSKTISTNNLSIITNLDLIDSQSLYIETKKDLFTDF